MKSRKTKNWKSISTYFHWLLQATDKNRSTPDEFWEQMFWNFRISSKPFLLEIKNQYIYRIQWIWISFSLQFQRVYPPSSNVLQNHWLMFYWFCLCQFHTWILIIKTFWGRWNQEASVQSAVTGGPHWRCLLQESQICEFLSYSFRQTVTYFKFILK